MWIILLLYFNLLFYHSSLELDCDIHVLLAHIQEALDSSVDGITTPVPDAVGMSHAKKVLVHSCIDITDP